jgi:hypothetical protein
MNVVMIDVQIPIHRFWAFAYTTCPSCECDMEVYATFRINIFGENIPTGKYKCMADTCPAYGESVLKDYIK